MQSEQLFMLPHAAVKVTTSCRASSVKVIPLHSFLFLVVQATGIFVLLFLLSSFFLPLVILITCLRSCSELVFHIVLVLSWVKHNAIDLWHLLSISTRCSTHHISFCVLRTSPNFLLDLSVFNPP